MTTPMDHFQLSRRLDAMGWPPAAVTAPHQSSNAGSNQTSSELTAPSSESHRRLMGQIRADCLEARDSCHFDQNFVADGSGYQLAIEQARTIFSPQSPLLAEFKAWNTKVARPWHNDHPPCTCALIKLDRDRICEVCYQIHTKIKRPWYIDSPKSPGSDGLGELCEDCSHVDFGHLVKYQCKDIPIRSLRSIFERRNVCAFCRLLTNTLHTQYGPELVFDACGYPIFCTVSNAILARMNFISLYANFEAIPNWTEWPRPPWTTRLKQLYDRRKRQSLATVPGAGEVIERTTGIHLESMGSAGDILPYEHSSPYFFRIYQVSDAMEHSGGRLVPDTVDFLLLKEWIGACDAADHNPEVESHTGRANVEHSFPFRVIDVCERRIKRIDRQSRYLALSYVWGGCQPHQTTLANLNSVEMPGGLDFQALPQTIQDAITVVLQIGESYLWVDSLCIVQDDPVSKTANINAMDKIFEGAVVTIVADFGDNANAGLVGIKPNRFRRQHREKLQGRTFVNDTTEPFPLRRGQETRSNWSTRAWTFQEEKLSRRLLYFGVEGIRLRNEHGEVHEQYYQPEITVNVAPNPLIYDWIHDTSCNWQCYNFTVREYTSRKMSLSTDALNAFTGIIAHLRPLFRGDFIFGLPMTEMDLALLWRPASRQKSVKRRMDPDGQKPIFPSWSWAGWEGEVLYSVLSNEYLAVLTWVDPATDELFTSNKLRDGPSVWKTKGQGRAPFYYETEKPDTFYLRPIAPEEKRPRVSLISPRSEHLHFETMSALFMLMRMGERRHRMDVDATEHELGIFTVDGILAGNIYGPRGYLSMSKHELVSGELIAISRTHVEEPISPLVQEASRDPLEQEKIAAKGKRRSRLFSNANSIVTQDDPLLRTIRSRYRDWHVCEPNTEDGKVYGGNQPFDRTYFQPGPWCLYNVMLIEWKAGVAYRIGIGICHEIAFNEAWLANPVQKRIVLG